MRADFTEFYEREAPRVVRSLTLAIGDPELAEDAAAEAFAKAWSRWRLVRGHDRPAAWVMRVALNESRSRFRRRAVARRKRHLVANAETAPPAEAAVPEVWAAVASLPEPDRTLVALRYVGDLTQPQIAEALGMRPGSVASGLHRARRRLAELLQPTYQEVF